jgi:tripartite ATP-independent transporter DctP family solute receptor
MEFTRRSFGRVLASAAILPGSLTGYAHAQTAGRMSMGSPMPQTHPITTSLMQAVDDIRRETGGRVDIEFFPNSQLGSELSMQSQLRSGALDFTATSVSSLQTLVPLVGMPGVAFAFNGYNELWRALDDGEMGVEVRAALNKLGLKAFRVLDNGFRHVITGAKPIKTVSDLNGMKIRVPPSPLLTSLFKLVGASPTTINLAETYAALQTKVADGMENSLPNIEATKVYEVQKFIARTGHSWDGLWILANQNAWDRLPTDFQGIIEKHFNTAVDRQRKEFLEMEASSEGRLKAYGTEFTDPDREQFRKALVQAGYYAEWKQKFGAKAWADLERFTGPLGA